MGGFLPSLIKVEPLNTYFSATDGIFCTRGKTDSSSNEGRTIRHGSTLATQASRSLVRRTGIRENHKWFIFVVESALRPNE